MVGLVVTKTYFFSSKLFFWLDKIAMWNDDQFFTIEISNASVRDSGVYTATARNKLGSVSCHCNLIVDKGIRSYIAPEFLCNFDPVYTVKENQDVRVSAQIEAYPTVGVTWHKNGIRLRPCRKIITTLDDDGFVELHIRNATAQDAGIYTCIASNMIGRTESSCHIQIEDHDNTDQMTVPDNRVASKLYDFIFNT